MDILIVDDEQKIADILAERLNIRNHNAEPVYDGGSALRILTEKTFAGVLLDLRLPDMDGSDVLREIIRLYPATPVIIISGHASEKEFETCLDIGAAACFQKPVDISKVLEELTSLEKG